MFSIDGLKIQKHNVSYEPNNNNLLRICVTLCPIFQYYLPTAKKKTFLSASWFTFRFQKIYLHTYVYQHCILKDT